MKTQGIEALIEHCKHVGIMERITMLPKIIEAEEELKAIKSASPPPPATNDPCSHNGWAFINGEYHCFNCGSTFAPEGVPCPHCKGTALSPYPDDGGSCPHCFNGYLKVS